MKIILLILIFSLTGCIKSDEMPEQKISFQKMNREFSSPPVLVEKEIIIGEGRTKIIDTGKNRVSNIILACNSVNGTKLLKGEEFSFNRLTGKRTKARGYKDAPVIYKGEKSYGVGGGVCQVSTTIYLAVKDAGLKITQRYQHSERVAYAPNGDDATVVFGEKDFCFKNNTDKDIYVYTETDGENVYAKITTKSVVVEKSDNIH